MREEARNLPFMTARYSTLVVAAILSAVPVAAAEDRPRVNASAGVSAMSPGPGGGIARGLRAGFGGTAGAGGSAPISRNLLHLYFQAQVGVGKRDSVGLFAGGVRAYTVGEGEQVQVSGDYTIDTIAVVYSRWISPWLRAGAGPAMYDMRVSLGSSTGPVLRIPHDRSAGALADVTLSVPTSRDRFRSIEITVQRRQGGSLRLGPQSMPLDFGYGQSRGAFQWPDMRIPVSHWMFSAGMGLRF